MKISFFVPIIVAAYATAHGFVAQMTIDGQSYPGNNPYGATNPSIIRKISNFDPVKGANNPDINCGPGAGPASDIGTANPGSIVTFNWNPWPHNTGPIIDYMASCGDTPCNQFDSRNAQWFKIAQVGRKNGNGEWVQQDIMNGQVASVQLPSNLAPGNYLIRHEIIALHLSSDYGGAEFYPSCSQIRVGGNGNGRPSPNELVTFPGAYSDTDSGILLNAFDNNAVYNFPGPAISQLASGPSGVTNPSGSGNNNAPTDNSGGNNTPNTPNVPNTPSPSDGSGNTGNTGSDNGYGYGGNQGDGYGSTDGNNTDGSSQGANDGSGSMGGCHLKKRSAVSVSAHQPRHLSRVMRDLITNGKNVMIH